MIHVVATITLNPGTRAKFLDAFRWLTPHVRAEAGCIEYQGQPIDRRQFRFRSRPGKTW